MEYKRIVSSEYLYEIEITNNLITLLELNLEDGEYKELKFKLMELNKTFDVGFEEKPFTSSIKKLEELELINLISLLMTDDFTAQKPSNKLISIVHSLYAVAIGLNSNPTMQVGYELYHERDVVGVSINCIDHHNYAFNESFLTELFNSNTELKFDFLKELPSHEIFGKFIDYYQKGISQNSGKVQLKLRTYTRRKKLSKLLP